MKLFIKCLPYFISLIVAFIILMVGMFVKNQYVSSLLNSISASFFAIPLIFIFYQKVENYSKNKLNKEIFEYCQIGVNDEILSISNQIHKIIHPLQGYKYKNSIFEILNLSKNQLEDILKNNEFLGFQVYKHWEVTINHLEKLLENPLILRNFDDDIIKCVISILKHIYRLGNLLDNKDLYYDTGKYSTEYIVVKGTDINKENKLYPDRYLLMKPIDQEHSIVVDFGDLYKHNKEKCLKIFKINDKYISILALELSKLLNNFNTWKKLTSNQLITPSIY